MTLRIEKPAFNLREKLTELDVPVGNSGSQLMRADTVREAFEHIQAGRKNLIINGDMRIAQRATTKNITADGMYTVDRWHSVGNSSMTYDVTMSQESYQNTPYMPHRKSVKFRTNTAKTPSGSENFIMRQKIEAQDFFAASRYGMDDAKWLTVSFWVKSNKPGIYSFQAYTAVSTGNWSTLTSYTVDSRDVWEYKVIHIPPLGKQSTALDMRTGTHWGMMMDWHLSDSPNDEIYPYGWKSGGSARCVRGQTNILAAVGAYIEFTGIQCEVGRQATPFEYRSYAEELTLCKRYYQQVGPASSSVMILSGAGNGNSRVRGIHPLIPEMRDTPSVALDTSSENPTFYSYSGSPPSYSSVNGFSGTTKNIFWDFNTSTHNQAGHDFDIKGSGAFLTINAEM